jgi:Asp-tRNA(Asn)/Glu-tRNA(Gln) amidotransferase A subunit family amidase
MIHVEGEYSTIGYVGHLTYPPADGNAVIADMLEAAGAVFYCKTNVPQTLFVSSRPGLHMFVVVVVTEPNQTCGRSPRASTMYLGARSTPTSYALRLVAAARVKQLR